MTSRTLPRFVTTMVGNSPLLAAQRILRTCADQTTNPRAAFAVMMDFKRRVWIDKVDAAIPEEHLCTVTSQSCEAWLAAELAEELIARGDGAG